MGRRFGCILATCVVGALVLTTPLAGQRDEGCSEWTDWSPVHPLPILFSWRMCQTTTSRYDIQWRFANNSSEPVEVNYELYTGLISECGEKNRGRLFTKGKYRLDGDQWDERYSRRKTLRRTGFEERFWLYLCVVSEPT